MANPVGEPKNKTWIATAYGLAMTGRAYGLAMTGRACGLAMTGRACGVAMALFVGHAQADSMPSTQAPFGIEIIVRTAQNFHRASDVRAFVEQAAKNGVQTISLLVKQDEDGAVPSGRVYYRSGLAPSVRGYEHFDVLQTLLDAAHARQIRVRAWLPQFHDQVAAKAHPSWQMRSAKNGKVQPFTGSHQKEFFVDPLNPEVQAYELSLIREVVEKYRVDGLMLDWIRFDDYNMDLGDTTRAKYQALHGIDPLTLDFSKPGAALDQWNDFRTDGLANYVSTVRSEVPAAIEIGVYILPPEFIEVGQDAAKFNTRVNTLAPMCYFKDWGFPVEWFWSSCLSSTVAKAGQAGIAPAIDANLSDAQYAAMLDHMRRDFAQIKTIAWFQHEAWTPALMARVARLSTR